RRLKPGLEQRVGRALEIDHRLGVRERGGLLAVSQPTHRLVAHVGASEQGKLTEGIPPSVWQTLIYCREEPLHSGEDSSHDLTTTQGPSEGTSQPGVFRAECVGLGFFFGRERRL